MLCGAETLALVEELYEICGQRGYDLALMPELAEQWHATKTALAEITARLDMDQRILTCLEEYQEQLIARDGPWVGEKAQDWARFRTAFASYTRQYHVTAARATLLHRGSRKLLRKFVTLARQGVI
jgi:hypothetical protein